jgi:hypothetical protein
MQRTGDSDAAAREHPREGRAPEPSVATPEEASPLKEASWYCLKVFLAVRIGLAVLALLSTALIEPLEGTSVREWLAPENVTGWSNLVTAWERWDALWFLSIATEGYAEGDGSAAFFPFYPLLIRGLSFVLGGHPLAAALLVSNLAFLGALIVVYRLTRIEFDDRTAARRTVLYLAIFPSAFFFLAPYSESLFLFLAAGSMLAARTGWWPLAGLAGALAAATRSIGIVLVLSLAIEAWLQTSGRRDGRLKALAERLWWAVFVAAGTLTYLGYWGSRSGDFFTPLRAQEGWSREFALPWETLVEGGRVSFRFVGQYAAGVHQVEWLMVLFALSASVWVAMRARATYVAYATLSLLIPLTLVFGGRPLMSIPRFLLPIFPLFWALTAFSDRFRAHELIVAVSAAGLGVLTLLFVTWYFVF